MKLRRLSISMHDNSFKFSMFSGQMPDMCSVGEEQFHPPRKRSYNTKPGYKPGYNAKQSTSLEFKQSCRRVPFIYLSAFSFVQAYGSRQYNNQSIQREWQNSYQEYEARKKKPTTSRTGKSKK